MNAMRLLILHLTVYTKEELQTGEELKQKLRILE